MHGLQPSEILAKCWSDNPKESATGLKQCQNAIAAVRRAEKSKNMGHQHNLSDEVEDIIKMWSAGSDYVKQVILEDNDGSKHPSIMLYTDDVIAEMRNIIGTDSAIPCCMTVDKTFNLSS